jgi:drug/metabolite transporter (DMT)-like permease
MQQAVPAESPAKSQGRLHTAWIAAMPALFVFLWATGFIGGKLGLPHAEPFTFLAVRMAIVVALLVLLSWIMRAPWPTDIRLIGHIAVAGLLVHATYLGGVFSGIAAGLSTGLSALIVGFQPVLTAVIAIPLLGERVTARQWAGLGLGLAGIVLIVWNKVAGGNLGGLLPTIVALVGITAGTLYQKRYCASMDLRTGSVIQFAASFVVLGALAVLFETREIQWTPQFMFALGWLVFVLSLGAISLLLALIRRGVASKVASLFYLVPPVTAVLGYLIFGERLGAAELAGMAAAVVGVYLVIRA